MQNRQKTIKEGKGINKLCKINERLNFSDWPCLILTKDESGPASCAVFKRQPLGPTLRIH